MRHANLSGPIEPAPPTQPRCEVRDNYHGAQDKRCKAKSQFWVIRGEYSILACANHLVRAIRRLDRFDPGSVFPSTHRPQGYSIKPTDNVIVKVRRPGGGF